MTVSPFLVLALSIPTLLLGEWIVTGVRPLARANIPVPVVGGLLVAVGILVAKATGWDVALAGQTSAAAWTWWVTPGVRPAGDEKQLILPLLVVLYTTLGLNASWEMVRRGGWFLALFLLSTGVISVLQNAMGLGIAKVLGAPAGLGLACGSVSLMGGFSTSVGFAEPLAKLGLAEAAGVGVAAATFGLVMSNVVSAPLGTLLIRRRKLAPEQAVGQTNDGDTERPGLIGELLRLGWRTRALWGSLVLLLACAKASAHVTQWMVWLGVENLPNQVSAMIVGLAVRNVHDALGLRLLNIGAVERIGSVVLAVFLAVAMMTLDLSKLRSVAGPMVVILSAQVLLACAYAFWVNFRMMGRDYEAAVTSSGLTGFALGATPNAMAAMRSLERAFGSAPKAFLVVPVTGAFLSDVLNVGVISVFIGVLS